MLPSISQSDRFKTDCARYKEYISKETDSTRKEKLNELYRKFVNTAREIDSFYDDLSSGAGIVTTVDTARTTLSELRRDLEKFCSSPNR